DHSTLFRVARKQHELLTIAAPVHRQHDASAVDRLFLGQDVRIMIKERDDARIFPEIDGHVLQAREIGTILAYGRTLGMPDTDMLQNPAITRKHYHAFIAAGSIHSDFAFGVAAEVAHYSAIGVILQLGVARPKLFAIVIPQRIANENLILAVT